VEVAGLQRLVQVLLCSLSLSLVTHAGEPKPFFFFLPDFLSSPSPATTPKLTDLQTCRRPIAHPGAMPTSTPPTTVLLCSEASGLQKVLPTPISILCCRFSASLPILSIYATVTRSWLRGMGNRLNQETTIFSLPVS